MRRAGERALVATWDRRFGGQGREVVVVVVVVETETEMETRTWTRTWTRTAMG